MVRLLTLLLLLKVFPQKKKGKPWGDGWDFDRVSFNKAFAAVKLFKIKFISFIGVNNGIYNVKVQKKSLIKYEIFSRGGSFSQGPKGTFSPPTSPSLHHCFKRGAYFNRIHAQ